MPFSAASLAGVKQRQILILAVIVALAAAALGRWYLERGPRTSAVAAVRGTAVEIVYATGGVEPVRWAKVASVIRDRITEICDCEGKAVAKGDVLVRLDGREVEAGLRELKARGFSQARNVPGKRTHYARFGDDAGL
jgi:multidrug efflux pump subunit AcrA (membrane-fusion protein)